MTPETLKQRIDRVFRGNEDVEKVVLLNTGMVDPNFLYITGFTSGLFEYSYLILDRQGATLITSILEYETAKEQAVEGLKVVCANSTEEMRKYTGEELKGRVIGVNAAFMPYLNYKVIKKLYKPKKIVDVSQELSDARMVKDDEEIGYIRKAASITKWAMMLIVKEFKEGMTEAELATKFDGLSSSMGSQGPSFKTIVCFGKNAALPHHFPDETKLVYGDFILIDAGCKVNNYSSDITRTFIYGDDKSRIKDYEEKQEIYKTVKDAQTKAIRAIKPGVKGKRIDGIARKQIDNADGGKYKGKFIHSLGHSVGIDVHDGPGFSPSTKLKLERGMVITAEPGIYINGFGGVRIEDDVLVTEDGALVL